MIELHAEAPKIIVPLFARTLPELTAQAAAAQRADAADLVELQMCIRDRVCKLFDLRRRNSFVLKQTVVDIQRRQMCIRDSFFTLS